MLNDLVHQIKKRPKEEREQFVLETQELESNTLFLCIDRSLPFSKQIPKIETQLFYYVRGEKHKAEKETMMIEKKGLYDWLRRRNVYSDILSLNKSIDGSKLFLSNNHLTLFMKTDVLAEKRVPAAFKGMEQLTLEGRLQQHLTSFAQEVQYRKVTRVQETFQRAGAPEGFERFYPELARYAESEERKSCIAACIGYFSNELASVVVWLRTWKKLKSFKTVKLFLRFPDDVGHYEREYWLYMLGYGFSKSEYNKIADGKLVGAVSGDFNLNERKPYLILHGMKAKIPMRGTTEDIMLRTAMLKSIGKEQVNKVFNTSYGFSEGDVYPYNGTYLLKTEFANKQQVVTLFDNIPFQADEQMLRGTRSFVLVDVWGETGEETALTSSSLFEKVNKWMYSGLLEVALKLDTDAFFNTIVYKDALKKRTTSRRLAVEMCEAKKMWEEWLKRGIEPENEEGVLRIVFYALIENLMNLEIAPSRKKNLFSLYVSFQTYLQGESPMKQHLTDAMKTVKEALEATDIRDCQNDREFYFLAGQCATFLVKQTQAQNKTVDLLQPFFNCKTAGDIKEQLYVFSQRYGHSVSITGSKRFRRANAMVSAAEPSEGLNQANKGMFLAGMMADNALYEKKNPASASKPNGGIGEPNIDGNEEQQGVLL